MKVYMAMIDYGDGQNFYAAHNEAELDELVNEYVSFYWGERFDFDEEEYMSSYPVRERIERYFEDNDRESIYYSFPESLSTPTYDVTIEVLGGVASVAQCPGNVFVRIVDYDNMGDEE